MKLNVLKWSKTQAVALLAGFLGAFAVSAADPPAQPAQPVPLAQPGQPPPGRPDRGPGGPGGPGAGPRIAGGGGMMMLDDQQRELYRDAVQKHNEELRELDTKLRAAQKDFVHAVVAEKYDEKAVREKSDAVTKIQTDIMMLRAKIFSSVAPTLKPEQRDQLENSRAGTAIVTGGFGGMGGPIGGPGPGRRGPGGQ